MDAQRQTQHERGDGNGKGGRPLTPDEIERELEDTRLEMRQTIEALVERFSPDAMLHWAADYVSHGPKEFASNLADDVRRNPVPAVLTGIGLLWLMGATGRRGIGADIHPGDAWRSGRERLHERTAEARGRMQEKAGQAQERLGEHAGQGGSRAEQVRSRAAEAGGEARERLGQWRDEGRLWAVRTARRGREAGDYGRRLFEEQPLAVGVAGLAFGALLGAVLPRMRPAEPHIEKAREQAAESLGEAAEKGADKAAAGVEQAGTRAAATLEEQQERTGAGGKKGPGKEGPSSGGAHWH